MSSFLDKIWFSCRNFFTHSVILHPPRSCHDLDLICLMIFATWTSQWLDHLRKAQIFVNPVFLPVNNLHIFQALFQKSIFKRLRRPISAYGPTLALTSTTHWSWILLCLLILLWLLKYSEVWIYHERILFGKRFRILLKEATVSYKRIG